MSVSCTSFYKTLGFSDAAAAVQAAKDANAIAAAVDQGRDIFWQLATALIGTAGTVLSVLMAKWLNTEKKLTAAIIGGVEQADNSNVKASIQNIATAAGVEKLLKTRVDSLT
jgi:NAD/NADP transhydrogenase beta subunit